MRIGFDTQATFRATGAGLYEWRCDNALHIPGAEHTPKFKKGHWDGKYYPGIEFRQGVLKASRGLLPILLESFPKAEITLPPSGPVPNFVSRKEHLSALRDYQKRALKEMMLKKWCRFAYATNAGKGAVIGAFSAAAAVSGHRALILCAQISVFDALLEQVTEWGQLKSADLGKVRGGSVGRPHQPIVVAMVPTLYGRIKDPKKGGVETPAQKRAREAWRKWLAGFSVVVVDEADGAAAPSFMEVLACCPNSEYRFGFSGTFPSAGGTVEERLLHLKLEELLGPIVSEVSNAELVAREISAKPTVQLFPYYHTNIKLPPPSEWYQMDSFSRRRVVYDEAVMMDNGRNFLIRDLIQEGMPTVIIVNRIEHGERLQEIIPGSVFLQGSDSPAHRQAVLKRFRDSSDLLTTLIVTSIFDRGTNDLGIAAAIIFASGTGSTAQLLQRIGRGLRRGGGKEFVFLRDVIDVGHEYLDSQSKKRVHLYNQQNFEVEVYRGGTAQIEKANAACAGVGLAAVPSQEV